MSNQSDFVIRQGVLVDYTGPGGDVVIPDGVTSIENDYLSGPFYNNETVTGIKLPEGFTAIGNKIFYGCNNLRHIELPDGLTGIGNYAFALCSSLKTIVLPESVESIGLNAFLGCRSLESITIPSEKIDYASMMYQRPHPFQECPKLRIPSAYLQKAGKVSEAYIDTIATMSEEDIAWLCLYQGAKEWRNALDRVLTEKNTNLVFSIMTDLITFMPKVTNTIGGRAADFAIMRHAFLDRAVMEKLCVQLEKKCKQAGARLRADPCMQNESEQNPLQKEYDLLLQKESGEKLLKDLRLDDYDYPEIEMEDGGTAPASLFKYLLVSYIKQEKKRSYWSSYYSMWGEPPADETPPTAFLPEVDQAAALLNRDKLCAALDDLIEKKPLLSNPALLDPYCRFASSKQISAVTTMVNKAQRGSGSDRRFAEDALRALQLSDTREAMLILDKNKLLKEYASMRDMDADILRDTVLAEFGLDELGKKVYDLGAGTVTASLNADLSLELYDDKAGKPVKSIPKKNTDPEKYEAAKADFAELKKNVRNAAKNRSNRLFEAFLDGREFKAADWIAVYRKNPVLSRVARLIVWSQDGKSFTLTENGAVDSSENPVDLSDKPIVVAHPLDMGSETVKAWQRYYSAHGMKQAFLQIWEPVYTPDEICESRYAGCMIPYYRFVGQEKHGITVTDEDFHNDIEITLKDCKASIMRKDWRRHEISMDDCFEVTRFGFDRYTRQVNHIVAYLDRITVWDRVRKDDLSVMDMMSGFTLAQITEFIAAAQEANAANVLTALLDYKNVHFAEFDPMDEFTLEW